ncbi:MAG: VCBS repeat-containing protein [Candidatus Hydrogenedentes bacterium]|nr:VCBS repeat-containing protein [Candidatus Hydrogenedentota bacterium]
MIAWGLMLALGALSFDAQDLPAVRVGAVNPLTGQVHVNYLIVDLDKNGEPDLLLPRVVLFQHDGKYGPAGGVPYPEFDGTPELDVWGADIYLRFPNRLVILRWLESAWSIVLDQPLEWPPSQDPESQLLPEYLQATPTLRASRFLYDLDQDGIPELIAAAMDGVHVYARDETYAFKTLWDIMPPVELAGIPPQRIWPPQDRRLSIPLRQMACRVFIEDQRVRVLTRSEPLPGKCAYRVRDYVVSPEDGLEVTPAGDAESAPMPEHMRPCRLNDDAIVDYAGGDWYISRAAILPRPIYETTATLDNGATLQTRRQAGLRPHCSFIDFDGDGDLDMVTEEPDLFDGSLRESVARFISRSSVEHEVFLFQQIGGHFSDAPVLRHQVKIDLAQAPFENGPMFQRYRSNELVNWTGDFNGDHYLDLAVQRSADELAIYLAAGYGMSSAPDIVLSVSYLDPFAVADVNGDGRSDIIVRRSESQEGPRPQTAEPETATVYFAREE